MKKRPTSKQLIQLKKIWFLFGNKGKLHTNGNHKIIQHLVSEEQDSMEIIGRDVKFYKADVTNECIGSVIRILIS